MHTTDSSSFMLDGLGHATVPTAGPGAAPSDPADNPARETGFFSAVLDSVGVFTILLLRVLRPALVAATATVLLAGCGAAGSGTSCDPGGCTLTFQRDGTATVSVLGVEARLVGVDAGSARIEVAGQQLTIPVGGQTQAEGFTVGVERVTDTEVVVRVSV